MKKRRPLFFMTIKILKSEYIAIAKAIVRKLFKLGCWGKGSLYQDKLKDGFPLELKGKVLIVAEALVRQDILMKKPKKYGYKFYLNQERRDKIDEIRKEEEFQ